MAEGKPVTIDVPLTVLKPKIVGLPEGDSKEDKGGQ